MMNESYHPSEEILHYFASHNWEILERHFSGDLLAAPGKAFQSLPSLEFRDGTWFPQTRRIPAYVARCEKHFPVRALSFIMNAFDINCARWYFDIVAHDNLPTGEFDLEWLCTAKAYERNLVVQFTLKGLEWAQLDFSRFYDYKMALSRFATAENLFRHGIAEYLVVVKYLKFVETLLTCLTPHLPIPVFATAHELEEIILVRFACLA